MKPKEVTELLGIDRERIKYLKKQGVFQPELPSSKGTTEYTEGDVEALRKLIVFNKAGLTCGDIRKMQTGEWTLSQAIAERRKLIFEEMERMKGSLLLSEEMMNDGSEYSSLETAHYWDVIQEKESEGDLFMDNWVEDTSPISLVRQISCPCCGVTQEVDLDEFVWDETCNESQRDNDMGPDIVYSFDSGEMYECPKCGRLIRISGWIREYPIGGYDSEDIDVVEQEEED